MTEGKKIVFDDTRLNTFTSDNDDWNLSGSSIKIREYGKSSFSKVFFIILSVSIVVSAFSFLIKLIK